MGDDSTTSVGSNQSAMRISSSTNHLQSKSYVDSKNEVSQSPIENELRVGDKKI